MPSEKKRTTPKVHPVARLLTLEQRQRAAATRFVLVTKGWTRVRAEDCRCPLEVALDIPQSNSKTPTFEALGLKRFDDQWGGPADTFMDDADNGKITPEMIPALLGIGPNGEDLLVDEAAS